MSYEYLALLAAACWAVGSLMSANASTHLGSFAFTRWRMLSASLMLWILAIIGGGWHSLGADNLWLLALSGVIGIFIGDTSLFAAMNRLGPRRAGVLFASHSLFSLVLAYLFLGETLWGWTLLGSTMLISGVMTAVFFGKRKSEQHAWEADSGKLHTGVALGLLSALCQAVSTLMLKPLMATEIDAIAASAMRMTSAFVPHFLLLLLGVKVARAYRPMTKKVFALVVGNAALSMVLGMTLILLALRHGNAGMVAILSSVSPVLVLPLLWLVYKRSPALGAWLGAILTVCGTMLILKH
ncbi:DMT family transporter [Shewanella sedimentimangrovi]|uniref:DMT family transporter n=1 Tax=Shewanella sedimentimangrovi TaxID=2814293 RepID=A0ABX7R0V3_9GAMM|nr:DMT family transporter [Shewanella sedimentimangrovi]QSX37426.1 DMT family transporter [Shewanella sedimentimangrovi]